MTVIEEIEAERKRQIEEEIPPYDAECPKCGAPVYTSFCHEDDAIGCTECLSSALPAEIERLDRLDGKN